MKPADEADLVRRAAADDVAAFAILVREHEAVLRRYLRRLAGEEADDLAQETFIAAWRAIGQWRGEAGFGAWLRTIATRRFLDQRRKKHIATAPLDDDHHPAHWPQSDSRLAINRALATLGDRERAAALLLFAEGHSHSEASAMMDVPLGTLKSIAARARAALIPLLDRSEA